MLEGYSNFSFIFFYFNADKFPAVILWLGGNENISEEKLILKLKC